MNLNKYIESINIINQENKKGEKFNNLNSYENESSNKCDIKSLRKEFSEVNSARFKKTKLFLPNGQIDEKMSVIKKQILIENPEFIKNREINNKKIKASINVYHQYEIDNKRFPNYKENKKSQTKNYLEVPIDIDKANINSYYDKNLNQLKNKENYNTLNLNENIEQQSISSFISINILNKI